MDFQHTDDLWALSELEMVRSTGFCSHSMVRSMVLYCRFQSLDSEVQTLKFRLCEHANSSPLSQLGGTRRKRFVIALSVQLICPVIGVISLIVCSRSKRAPDSGVLSAEFGVES